MRVLVCGGRNYQDAMALNAALSLYDNYHGPFTLLIHGGALGADTLAGNWAKKNHIPVRVFKADWERFGNAAGPIRNDRMLLDGKPEIVIAFPGGRGTADMIARARKSGIEVMEVTA